MSFLKTTQIKWLKWLCFHICFHLTDSLWQSYLFVAAASSHSSKLCILITAQPQWAHYSPFLDTKLIWGLLKSEQKTANQLERTVGSGNKFRLL